MNGKVWVIVSQTCPDCGSGLAVLVMENAPTPENIKDFEYELGGNYCITTKVLHGEVDRILTTDD